jgi:hypothetical protein
VAAPRRDASAAKRIIDVVDSNVAIRRSLGEAAPLRQDAVPFAMKHRFNFSNPHPTPGRMLVARSWDAGDGLELQARLNRLRMGDRLMKCRHRQNRLAGWRKPTGE